MLKRAQQILFLSTLIITPFVALFNYDEYDLGKCLSVFCCGFSTSLFVFCFVPYLLKYYLSELVILMLGFGTELTLFFNVYHLKMNAPNWTLWFTVLALCSFVLPLIAFILSERHRPETPEDPPEISEEPLLAPEAQQLRSARNLLLIMITVSILSIVPQLLSRASNNWFKIGLCVIWSFNLFMFLQRYLKARRELRKSAHPLSTQERADEQPYRSRGEGDR